MSMDQDLARLVREVVKAELQSQRLKTTEIVGRGGDTTISSMGNIFIQPGTNYKAYYHDSELGSGTGSGGAALDWKAKVSSNDTTPGYLNGKLVAGANISLTEGSDGADETLTIALAGGGAGDVYLANDNIFTGDHQYISGAGGSAANYPTLSFKNITHNNTFYSVLNVDDDGYLNIGFGDAFWNKLSGNTSITGHFYPFTTDSYDLGHVSTTKWWRNVYAQNYYIDDTSTYIDNVSGDMKFFDAANASGVTLSSLVSGGGDFMADGTVPMTGDLTIKGATPMTYFQDGSANPLGSIGSLGGGFYIGNDVDSGSIYIQTGTSPTTRVQVYDTGVALGVDLVMGSKNITFTTGTVDGVDISTHAANITTIHLPDQAGHTGQYLQSNGSVADWVTGAGVTDHGALTGLSDDDHTQYLLITGTRNMGATLLPNTSGAYNLGGVSNLWNFVWTKYIGGGSGQTDWIDFSTTDVIRFYLNSANVFQVADAAVTVTVPITTSSTVDGVDISAHTHSGANQGGTVSYNSLSDKPSMITGSGVSNYIARWNGTTSLTTGSIQDSGTIITLATALHSDVTTGTAPITVDSTTICTNLHAANSDTLDTYHASSFLLLSAGSGIPLIGDLYIGKSSPMLYLNDLGSGTSSYVQFSRSAAGKAKIEVDGNDDLYIRSSASAKIMYLQTSNTTKLSISDSAITASVPIAMGSNAITTSSTVDGVDISAHTHSGANQGGTVSYNSLSDKPSMVTGSGTSNYVARWNGTSTLTTGTIIDNGTNVGVGGTPSYKLDVAGTIRSSTGVVRFNNTGTYIQDVSGNMELHVPTGGSVRIVVG